MEVIRDIDGKVIRSSRNLAGIRRFVGGTRPPVIKTIDISPVGAGDYPAGMLSILFEGGQSYQTRFASFTVLKGFVRNWRNVYGAPLLIGGAAAGTVGKDNPALNG